MSINKLSHLKEGDKIYLEVTREKSNFEDNEIGLHFCKSLNSSIWVNDEDTFYTLDDLKQLANDGMPKQGDEIDVRTDDRFFWSKGEFLCFDKDGNVLIKNEPGRYFTYQQWRFPPKKTELTLAEVEERLGLDAGSLVIK